MRVVDVQERLQGLGILNSKGERLVADGDFGPSTEAAVKTFQHSVGLPATGSVGALTLHRMDELASTRRQLGEDLTTVPAVPPVCRLDDPAHADHSFFKQVRGHVVELDKGLGRSPDQHTDNLASALTVQARADGLHRVDEIALSADGNVLWAVQIPPGRKDHLFDLSTKVPTAEAATPMEHSAARWPEGHEAISGSRAGASAESTESSGAQPDRKPGPGCTFDDAIEVGARRHRL